MGKQMNPSRAQTRKGKDVEPLANLAVQQATMRAITAARQERGMTLRDIELASGVSPAMYADLAVMRKLLSVRQVVQLADAVGLRAVLVQDPDIIPDARVPGLP